MSPAMKSSRRPLHKRYGRIDQQQENGEPDWTDDIADQESEAGAILTRPAPIVLDAQTPSIRDVAAERGHACLVKGDIVFSCRRVIKRATFGKRLSVCPHAVDVSAVDRVFRKNLMRGDVRMPPIDLDDAIVHYSGDEMATNHSLPCQIPFVSPEGSVNHRREQHCRCECARAKDHSANHGLFPHRGLKTRYVRVRTPHKTFYRYRPRTVLPRLPGTVERLLDTETALNDAEVRLIHIAVLVEIGGDPALRVGCQRATR